MNPTGRRTTPELLQEILNAGPASWSSIRFSVGLNHSQAQRYLPFLVNEGYLTRRAQENGADVLQITDKGKRLLQLLSQLSDILEGPEGDAMRALPFEGMMGEGKQTRGSDPGRRSIRT
jgi:predicted transcriptional regulator